MVTVLKSVEDKSVNFIFNTGQEARYVRRTQETALVYLSSHNGCDKACRFCHLTQTKQTNFEEAWIFEFMDQAQKVLAHYMEEIADGIDKPAETIHYNWMARGEPLANAILIEKWKSARENLTGLARHVGVKKVKFKISTILPLLKDDRWFSGPKLPEIYYSLYSVNPEFRKRWLPNAAPLEYAAERLKYHTDNNGRLVLHWAFIKGENDSQKDVDNLIDFILANGLDNAKFNLVRYNPFSPDQGEESDEATLHKHFEYISSFMKMSGSRIVPRVGMDVSASCGTFVPKSVIPRF